MKENDTCKHKLVKKSHTTKVKQELELCFGD